MQLICKRSKPKEENAMDSPLRNENERIDFSPIHLLLAYEVIPAVRFLTPMQFCFRSIFRQCA